MLEYNNSLDTSRRFSELYDLYRQAAEDLLTPIITQLEKQNHTELFDLVKVDLGGRLIPVMFLYRHSVELQLKSAITLLDKLESEASKKITEHSVSSLWNRLKEGIPNHFADGQSQELLNPLSERLELLTSLIEKIDSIDPKSFTFRYDDSLVQKPELNVKWVQESFESCANSLEQIIRGLMAFIDFEAERKA